jgi:hypothetical protein
MRTRFLGPWSFLAPLWCIVAVAFLASQQPSNDAQAAKTQPAANQQQVPAMLSPSSPLIQIGNGRLKMAGFESMPINAEGGFLIVDGIWLPESNNPDDALAFPEQVKITCDQTEKVCRELKVTLAEVFDGRLTIIGPDETDWPISSWDARGLFATFGPSNHGNTFDKCHRHVLTMTFGSGAISTSDIPTREKGCEIFPKTNSYRLARGGYWIDTSQGSDFRSGKAH